jgi:hypothetical protein
VRPEASSDLWFTVAQTDYSLPGRWSVKRHLVALAAWRCSGRLHLPALLIDRHAHDFVHGRRRLGLLPWAEAQVREKLLDGYQVVEATILSFPSHLRHVSGSA